MNSKYKVEVYHPNSMQVVYRHYFGTEAKAKAIYEEYVDSDWNVVTLFERKGREWETLEANS
jgi:hypothetical protein